MNSQENYMYLNTLPYGGVDIPERIVCAANQYTNHNDKIVVIAGVRHACDVMYSSYRGHNSGEDILYKSTEVQGFLTSKHRFVDRKEAWKIALEQRQIVRLVGSQSIDSAFEDTELFSENLY